MFASIGSMLPAFVFQFTVNMVLWRLVKISLKLNLRSRHYVVNFFVHLGVSEAEDVF